MHKSETDIIYVYKILTGQFSNSNEEKKSQYISCENIRSQWSCLGSFCISAVGLWVVNYKLLVPFAFYGFY